MASEYLKWKYRDVKPEPAVELTPRQKRANWWYYHKWYVFLGAGALALGVYLTARALGLGQTTPDYQAAYVGSAALPEDTAAALERSLAELGSDCNGDGRVVVRLNQYVIGDSAGEGALYAYAGNTRLMADLESCDSYFFLLEDPETFQKNYQILRPLDGSLPQEGERDYKRCCLPGDQCPALRDLWDQAQAGLEQGDARERLSGLFVARRGFWTERTSDYIQACDALWEEIIRGSIR